ncbi:secreted RxLR effector protein 161-like [Capsicum annuum]|uniref:secreted RxLR effector protein 161-like n=1 Tax=Capsicum annuum TaxID=4072 RepID=UPI001FB13CD7|nr:secreted RxLR effector protein 161-like [Capsicum annuum]
MCQKEKLSKNNEVEKIDKTLYRSMVGCLMYLTATKPDILYVVSLLSRFTNCATNTYFRAAKRVIRYVKGTLNFGIKFNANQKHVLQGYSDSNWGGSSEDMKSISGYCFSLGSGVFSWCSKKQEIVAKSMAEAEFIAATAAANQALWLRKVLLDLNLKQEKCTEVFVDNQAAIAISNNPVSCKNQAFQYQIILSQRRAETRIDWVKVLQDESSTGRYVYQSLAKEQI